MIFRLFPGNRQEATIEALYGAIVAQARTPVFYRDYGVPDTVNGRFDMIILHLALVLERLEAESEAAQGAGAGGLRSVLPRDGRPSARKRRQRPQGSEGDAADRGRRFMAGAKCVSRGPGRAGRSGAGRQRSRAMSMRERPAPTPAPNALRLMSATAAAIAVAANRSREGPIDLARSANGAGESRELTRMMIR